MLKRVLVLFALSCLFWGCGDSSSSDDPEQFSFNIDSGGEGMDRNPSTAEEGTSEEGGPGELSLCEGVVCEASSACVTSLCQEGICVETALVGQPCDDGNACTVNDVCGGEGMCTPGEPRVCENNNACTVSECDPAMGCMTSFAIDGTLCDDGSLCTNGDGCVAGVCTGTPMECPDAQGACETPAGCDPATGLCAYEQAPDGTSCDDLDPCSTADSCLSGQCAGTPLIECFYVAAPDPSSCYEGILADERKQDALNELNWIRSLHGLAPVPYDASTDVANQKAALMMSVNSDLDHHPPESWACWSPEGDAMAGKGNLSIMWGWPSSEKTSPEEEMRGWMVDNNVYSLGHRRWLMDPFLAAISYGSVDGEPLVGAGYPWSHASVIQVMWDENANIADQTTPQMIAYPMGDYPASYVKSDWFLSASVLIDATSRWANQGVSFQETTISVVGPNGSLAVYDVSHNNSGYGIPNHIQWRVQGLQSGVEYTVTFQNVWLDGVWEDFTYTFRLI